MITSSYKEFNKYSKFLLILLVSIISIKIIYMLFGRLIIQTIYEGKSLDYFNKIITGQSDHTIDYYFILGNKLLNQILTMSAITIVLLFSFLDIPPTIISKWPSVKKIFKNHTSNIDSLPITRLGLWIALAAGTGLFMELMIIRVHSSYFQLFGYFKNITLLSCFLGLGIGYARASSRLLTTPIVIPLLSFQIIFLYFLQFSEINNFLLLNPIREQHAFGLGRSQSILHSSFIYLFLTTTFSFNALCFVPLGQLASRLMIRKNKLVAYSWNLIGSLLGIILFFIMSLLWLPPTVWFLLGTIILFPFLYKEKVTFITSVASMVLVITILSIPTNLNEYQIYSPYQQITLRMFKDDNSNMDPVKKINMNILTGHAFLQSFKDKMFMKDFWFYFKSNPKDALIVGSGTGDDVSAALQRGVANIDAVEIDPVIQKFGEHLHPDSPYNSPNVNIIIDDARAHIRNTKKKYDLIVYGFLDSHTLLSNQSGGIRLDSYVYTVEAFREARKLLKDDGIIQLSFATAKPELGQKFYLMLKDAFDGQAPSVYKVGTQIGGGGHFFVAGNKMQSPPDFPQDYAIDISSDFENGIYYADKSTDDWPFLYMPVRKYPITYVVVIMLLSIISFFYVRNLTAGSLRGYSIPCFFLGAGFMLVETKAITELALYYGSTWIVISIVIAAILIMAFMANLIVYKIGAPSTIKTYSFLFLSLLCGLLFTFIDMEYLPRNISTILMTLILTLPIFFSGFAFSNELRKTSSLPIAFSSNILGAMMGGFLEYNSMYFGFRSLYIFALLMYMIAFISSLTLDKKEPKAI